jgi:hypothetical protein
MSYQLLLYQLAAGFVKEVKKVSGATTPLIGAWLRRYVSLVGQKPIDTEPRV